MFHEYGLCASATGTIEQIQHSDDHECDAQTLAEDI